MMLSLPSSICNEVIHGILQDIVMVSISYRLNAFGFLSFEDPIIPGNIGLIDQYLGILWVSQNIGNGGFSNTLLCG